MSKQSPVSILSPTAAKGLAFGIVVARFNSEITDSLLKASIETLKQHGADENNVKVVYVPGAFELAIAAKQLAETKKFNAIITIAAVIRGGTYHFEVICNSCSNAIPAAALQSGVPIIFGVITTDTIQQAWDRASSSGNKGTDAALAAIEMALLSKEIAK